MRTATSIYEAINLFLEEFNEEILDSRIEIYLSPLFKDFSSNLRDEEKESERLHMLYKCGLLTMEDILKREDSWYRVSLCVWTENFIVFTYSHEYGDHGLKVLPRNPVRSDEFFTMFDGGTSFIFHEHHVDFSAIYEMIGK